MADFSEKAGRLLTSQLNDWPLAAKNYSELQNVRIREFEFADFKIKVQFNPARIVSSAAKVDKQSVEKRRCFLCRENRPAEQQQLAFGDYDILVNPFPVFPEHFTIPFSKHVPQGIRGRFGNMLDLAKVLPDFTVFYNGPECGASAPDHLHFQAGKKGFMPLEKELEKLKQTKGRLIRRHAGLWTIDDGLRRFLLLEQSGKEELETCFSTIYSEMNSLAGKRGGEPMMNILAGFAGEKWQVCIFPRFRHRPWQYFEEGGKNILLSPASVDLGGLLIIPLEKDFSKITRKDIADIFQQVLWPVDQFRLLTEKLRDNE